MEAGLDLGALRIFIDVARHGGFSPVARDRDLDPSSVSRVISVLEVELGVRLFQRTTRRLTLTEAGSLYFDRIEALVDNLDAARDDALAISSGPLGTLRLTASVAFGHACLTPLLPAFRETFPALKLELLLSDANLDLVSERIDLAIRLGPSVEADVVGVKLFDTRYKVCASPGYLAGAPALIAPDDLRTHRCLRFTLPEFRTRWLFGRRDGETSEVPVDGDLIISNALALRDCALAGLGPALLADWLIDKDLAEGTLVDCFPDHHVAATSFDTAAWLLYPSRAFLPNKVRATIDFLRRQLGSRQRGGAQR